MDDLHTMQKRVKEPKYKLPGDKKTNTADPVRVFYKGDSTDLAVFAHTKKDVEEYRSNPDIKNLSEVVDVFQVFTTGKGVRGELGEASHSQMEDEFGKGKKTEEVIDAILRKGRITGIESAISTNTFEH